MESAPLHVSLEEGTLEAASQALQNKQFDTLEAVLRVAKTYVERLLSKEVAHFQEHSLFKET